ncbi:MAG: HD domain-containing protein [Actinobacteria bacterium]|nr:MAG: HD domain-containing protein [Actinomycetota bacterium]
MKESPGESATGGSASSQAVDLAPSRWRTRRGTAIAIRVGVVVGPAAASVVAARLATGLLPRPSGIGQLAGWWAVVVAVAAITLAGVDRAARRLLPLAALYRLALVFPDKAPSRYRIALRSGTTHQLSERVRSGESLGDTPSQAAENLLALIATIGRHDRITRGHSERVRAYSDLIGKQLGLSVADREKLHWSALVHDAGKIHVRSEVLNKAGRPTDEEWIELRAHPAAGGPLVEPLRPWLGEWVDAATQHHERVDGAGYPAGLKGDEISLAGRIVAVADAYDQARFELTRNSGTQFDADVVRAFLGISLGRLHLIAGPFAWLSQIPLLAPVTTAASAAGTTIVGSIAAAIGVFALQVPATEKPASASPAVVAAADVGSRESDGSGTGSTRSPTASIALDRDGRPIPTAPGQPGATTQPGTPTTTLRGASTTTTSAGGSTTSTTRTNTTTSAGESTTSTTAGGNSTTTVANPTTTTTSTTTPTTTTSASTSTTTTTTTTTTTVNAAPIARDDYPPPVVLQSFTDIDVLANDSDPGGALVPATLQIVSAPSRGSATVVNGMIRYTAPLLTLGTTTLTYRICDNGGACAQAVVTITIIL